MAKTLLRDSFVRRGLKAEVEYELPGLGGDRRADVLVWSPSGKPVAIELQHAAIGLVEIERRAASYAKMELAQMWLPFLRPGTLDNAERRPGGNDGDWFVARYRALQWERWVHGFNHGEVWFYDASKAMFWRGRFERHEIATAPRSWLERGLREVFDMSDVHCSKRWRELTLWGPYHLEQLRIDVRARQRLSLGPHTYPRGMIARFVAPIPAAMTG